MHSKLIGNSPLQMIGFHSLVFDVDLELYPKQIRGEVRGRTLRSLTGGGETTEAGSGCCASGYKLVFVVLRGR